jgi:hypothetical protein
METLSNDEIVEKKRRILASMTQEEQRERFLQACERAAQRDFDEFKRQHTERVKNMTAEKAEPIA